MCSGYKAVRQQGIKALIYPDRAGYIKSVAAACSMPLSAGVVLRTIIELFS